MANNNGATTSTLFVAGASSSSMITPASSANVATSTLTSITNPVELCTIARAEELGIYNGESQAYGTDSNGNTYNDLRTYDSSLDNSQNRTQSFCVDNGDNTSSRICLDQYGSGFKKTLNSIDPTQPYTCQVNDCPTGFTKTATGSCQKPTIDAEIPKVSKCDEKWSDWFIIPNYHLGNNYSNVGNLGSCYVPCGEYQVPGYVIDPVDGQSLDYVTNSNLSQCVPRDQYFYGKYMFGADYCPLAWIHRLNSTSVTVSRNLQNSYNAFNNSNMVTAAFSQYLNNSTSIKQMANSIQKQASTAYENIDPLNSTMQIACNDLNTEDRVQAAYNWCEELSSDEAKYRNRIISECGSNLNIDIKVAMMKQACNRLFCNSESTALNFVPGNQICFTDAPTVIPGIKDVAANIAQNKYIKSNDRPIVDAPNDNIKSLLISNIIYSLIVFMILPIVIYLFILLWNRILFPKVFYYVYMWIRRTFFGEYKEVQELRLQFIKENLAKAKLAKQARFKK